MAKQIEFPVFSDDRGNRFVFPSIRKDGEKSIDWWQCRTLSLAIGLTEEPERLVVPEVDGAWQFTHIKTEIAHRGFAHGAASVYLISGPVFDEIAGEEFTEKPTAPETGEAVQASPTEEAAM